jgi:hypothetical protein
VTSRGLGRIEWPDPDGTDFHQPHGERIKLLRDTGFEIEALHELAVRRRLGGAPHLAAV